MQIARSGYVHTCDGPLAWNWHSWPLEPAFRMGSAVGTRMRLKALCPSRLRMRACTTRFGLASRRPRAALPGSSRSSCARWCPTWRLVASRWSMACHSPTSSSTRTSRKKSAEAGTPATGRNATPHATRHSRLCGRRRSRWGPAAMLLVP
eukprot:3789362-Pleurochrysis_carterae.AAC.2